MSVAEVVPRLVDGLAAVGWLQTHQLATPVGEGEIRRIATEVSLMDPDWIDDDILAWWSWHNGIVGQGLDDHRGSISPDLYLGVAPFEMMCRDFFDDRSELALDVGAPELIDELAELPTIPLVDADGSHLCLRKIDPSSGWVLWQLPKEWEWGGLACQDDAGDGLIQFDEYLGTLCDRLDEGAFVTSRSPAGHLVRAGAKEPEVGVDLWFYPWL